ncbi:hypothetical protein IV203_033945 [Nitzschia inconspicua]|uniref:Tesmin/TSO1-like CXC domain-containing protein n=1 Tax=Nitzschia inconspicua TaxID=303405 RepID=A0A9K3M515_9STRA|nr:hypothetical protein IV203_033945 [Nitzschia inconspicua]
MEKRTEDMDSMVDTDKTATKDIVDASTIDDGTAGVVVSVSKKRKRSIDPDAEESSLSLPLPAGKSGNGCSCDGTCLKYTCSCFVQGRICHPSSCNCCVSSAERNDVVVCQNNDQEENIDRRKESLMAAMQQHPDLFWNHNKPKRNDATPSKSMLILESTDSNEEEEDKAAAAKDRSIQIDKELWFRVQTLLQEKLAENTSGNADMDVDAVEMSTSSGLNLGSIHSYLEGLLKDLANEQPMEDVNTKEDVSKDEAANILVQASTKDLLQVVRSMLEVSKKVAPTESRDGHSEERSRGGIGASSNNDACEPLSKEEWMLRCPEEFPDDKITATDDAKKTYYEILASKAVTFANTGNSNDPLVHNLICKETGFFEGDNADVLEEGDLVVGKDKDSEREVQLRLRLIQETTHIIRSKTLELARQRLSRQTTR